MNLTRIIGNYYFQGNGGVLLDEVAETVFIGTGDEELELRLSRLVATSLAAALIRAEK